MEPWNVKSIEERRGERQSRVRPYSEIQLFFLLRLERLLRLKREHATLSSASDWWTKLLSRAIYSTFCDCIEQGVGEDARKLLARDQAATEA